MSDLRLFLLSDIHAFDGTGKGCTKPSHFDISRPSSGGADDPIEGIRDLIKDYKISADFVVYCGDLCDKAHPASTSRAWAELQTIATYVSARDVISTVGNHDLDSRHQHNGFDARGVLLDLRPPFPLKDERLNCEFWTHHFSVVWDEASKARFVVLNSSAYHGEREGPEGHREYEHGRIAERTIKRLLRKLGASGPAALNILVCHHHPHKHSECNLGDYDEMIGGYDLLQKLDPVSFGPWIVIHGHKHHPKVTYATGGTGSPVVFSAGSCAAVIQPELYGHARNQVYEVTLKLPDSIATSCRGRFRAWDWSPGIGWAPAQTSSGLPGTGGFGFRGDLGSLAAGILNETKVFRYWREVRAAYPDVAYLLPSDVSTLCEILRRQGAKIERNEQGEPILIEK